jgi:transposase
LRLRRSLTKLSQKFAYHPAIRYAPSRWVALVRYGDEGRVEIDNNAAERTRTAALGREEPAICRIGRQRQAAIYILISSAKT